MTGPVVAGGARNFVLTPGAAPTLLTEYAGGDQAPLSVINTSSVRVYLAADGAVAPSSGVPLDPMTSLPWSTAGQLWAIADPAGSGPAAVTITSAIDSWTPSPATIAAEVAAQLLATGIPPVYTATRLLGPAPVNNGDSVSIDVTNYSELIINADPCQIQVDQYDSAGGTLLDSEIVQTIGNIQPVRMQLLGTSVTITNKVGARATINVLGTNRPPGPRLDTRRMSAGGDRWDMSTQAVAAGNTYPLLQAGIGVQLQGLAWADFQLSGNTITGQFWAQYGGQNTILCDSAEMYAANGTNARALGRLIALPPNDYTIAFHCGSTSGNVAAHFTAISADL